MSAEVSSPPIQMETAATWCGRSSLAISAAIGVTGVGSYRCHSARKTAAPVRNKPVPEHGVLTDRLAARLAADSVIETELASEIPRDADQLDYYDED